MSIHSIAQARSARVARNCSGANARAPSPATAKCRPERPPVVACTALDQRVQRQALIEREERHARIAPELRGEHREMRRLARAGRPEHQRVADVADVQIRGGTASRRW